MALSTNQIYEALNTAYKSLGFGAGNDPVVISDANIADIGVLPKSMIVPLFNEINVIVAERFFSNYASLGGLARMVTMGGNKYGFGVRDRIIDLLEMEDYPDPSDASAIAADLVRERVSPVAVHVISDALKKRASTTINEQQIRKFFASADGVSRYAGWLSNNLYSSLNAYLLQVIAEDIKTRTEGENMVVLDGYTMNTQNGIRALIADMMTACEAFRQPTDLYNKREKVQITPDDEDILILTTPSRWNRAKAFVFADTYHLDQLYADGRVIFLPEGADMGDGILFVVIDARGEQIDITTLQMDAFDVANMNWRNLFLHVEGEHGFTPFANAVAFKGDFGAFQ